MESTDFSAGIREALDRGDHAQALVKATDAVSAFPDSAQAWRLLAAAQRATGDATQALASIDRAIALAPDDAGAHFERAGLLLGARQLDAAQAALARSLGLDPNLFGAYVMQAQLALGRGDLDEAERLRRLAARIAPGHPQLAAIEGTLALRRNDPARAQTILATALQHHPGDAQVGYALGFVYMAQGHLAFAEQAFRNVLASHPDAGSLRALIADLVRQQGRHEQAVQEIAPLLADPARATPGLRRIAGELELAAGHPERALPWLRDALGAQPGDQRTLTALLETLRRLGDRESARSTLEAALATSPQLEELWQARLSIEAVGTPEGEAVLTRWQGAMPESIPALEARMLTQDSAGDHAAAEATAQRIIAIQPGRSSGELRLFEGLLERDPPAAIARVEHLLAQASEPRSRSYLSGWLGMAQDRAGQVSAAVATWTALRADEAAERLPPWTAGAAPERWPDVGTPARAAPVALLWGPPGSSVERVAAVLADGLPAFRADRFGPEPPSDALQRFTTIAALQAGALAPTEVVAQWRATLPARGIDDGQIVDWLLFWDNQLLRCLRPDMPEARLLIPLRDPRDMLLDWLAFGAAASPIAIVSPLPAANWLAGVLDQVATLHEQDLQPHRLLRLDAVLDDAAALATLVGNAVDSALPIPTGAAYRRFPPGHWRRYAEPLSAAFDVLTPAARRLGYE